MNLYQKLKLDLIEYRKNKDANPTKLLQTLVGELNTQEKNKVVIDDSYVIKTVKLFIKYNSETIVKNDFSIELLHDAYYYLKENYTIEEIGDHAYQAIHFLRGEKPFENEWRELKNFH